MVNYANVLVAIIGIIIVIIGIYSLQINKKIKIRNISI